MTRVVVAGAGIAGLSIAHALGRRDRSLEIVVIERAPRTGGHIRSDSIGGYLCESGPDGFLDNAPDTTRLVSDLGLQPRLQPSNEAARRRFVFRRGRLHQVPLSPAGFATTRLLSIGAKARVLCEPLARHRPDGDESIFDFAARRIGREPASVLIDAMVSGVFAGDARALSLRACFPKMWDLETRHGGLVRALIARRSARTRRNAPGMPAGHLTSFIGGMTELPDALARHLGPAVRCGTELRTIARARFEPGYRLATSTGPLDADAVVLAGPAADSAALLTPIDRRLAALLDEIPTAPLAVVCLGFDAATVDAYRGRFDGFGFLVPRGEGVRTLGALFESTIYPGRAPLGKILVRAMVGGAADRDVVDFDDANLVRLVRDDLRRTMSLCGSPEFSRVVRHRRGIPQYTIGHLSRLTRLDELLTLHPGLFLAGNSYRGVSVNACIADAQVVADRVVEFLRARRSPDRDWSTFSSTDF